MFGVRQCCRSQDPHLPTLPHVLQPYLLSHQTLLLLTLNKRGESSLPHNTHPAHAFPILALCCRPRSRPPVHCLHPRSCCWERSRRAKTSFNAFHILPTLFHIFAPWPPQVTTPRPLFASEELLLGTLEEGSKLPTHNPHPAHAFPTLATCALCRPRSRRPARCLHQRSCCWGRLRRGRASHTSCAPARPSTLRLYPWALTPFWECYCAITLCECEARGQGCLRVLLVG